MTCGLSSIVEVTFLSGLEISPLWIAFAAGKLANLHAVAILHVLPIWQADVPTL